MYDADKHWLLAFTLSIMDGHSPHVARFDAQEKSGKTISRRQVQDQLQLAQAVREALYEGKTISGVATTRGTTPIGGRGSDT